MHSLLLTGGRRAGAVGPSLRDGERLRVGHVRVEGQQPCGAFLDQADSRVTVAMHAALVACGLSKPPCEVQGVLWQVRSLSPDEQPRGKTRHHAAHVVLHRVSALLQLRVESLELRVPLGHWARSRLDRRLERPKRFDVGSQRRVDVRHGRQPAGNVARYARQRLGRSPPFSTARFRWMDA